MTPERLEAIRQRVEKATQGPWNFEGNKWQDGYVIYSPIKRGFHNNGGEVAEVDDSYEPSDAEFIAHAREDVPALLAEVERLRSAIDNAADLLSGGESRLANRYLCGALGVDENYYGYFGEDDD